MGIKRIVNKTAILYTLYTVLAVLFFVWYLFPSEYFANYIERSLTAYSQDVSVTVGGVNPAFPAGIKLTGVEVTTAVAGIVPVDYFNAGVKLISLIKRDPVFTVSAGFLGGNIQGIVKIPDGDIANLSVSDLVVKGIDLGFFTRYAEAHLPGCKINGRLDATGSYEVAGRGHGKLSLVANQLRVKPEKPYLTLESLTFNEITAEIELKSKRIQIESCDIDGQEFDGSLKGSVIIKHPVERSVLRLSGKFKPEEEFAEKLPLDLLFKRKVKPGDELPFKISGTINKPRVR